MNRHMLCVTLCALITLTATGCGTAPTPAPPATQAPASGEVLIDGQVGTGTLINQLAEQFTVAQPSITVRVEGTNPTPDTLCSDAIDVLVTLGQVNPGCEAPVTTLLAVTEAAVLITHTDADLPECLSIEEAQNLASDTVLTVLTAEQNVLPWQTAPQPAGEVIAAAAADVNTVGVVRQGSLTGEENVRTVSIRDEVGECISPTVESIQAGRYPLAQALLLHIPDRTLQSSPAAAEFLKFAFATGDLEALAVRLGYTLPPDGTYAENLGTLQFLSESP